MATSPASPARRVVNVADIPQPLAHKSMAVVNGDTVYVSGQLGKGPDGKPLPTAREQTYQAMRQLEAILLAAGSDMNHISRMGMYVVDIDDVQIISDVLRELVPVDPPASFALQVAGLALGAKVEIDAIATVVRPRP